MGPRGQELGDRLAVAVQVFDEVVREIAEAVQGLLVGSALAIAVGGMVLDVPLPVSWWVVDHPVEARAQRFRRHLRRPHAGRGEPLR
jgi:hypothetical protein